MEPIIRVAALLWSAQVDLVINFVEVVEVVNLSIKKIEYIDTVFSHFLKNEPSFILA